jgi:hypothetical protein
MLGGIAERQERFIRLTNGNYNRTPRTTKDNEGEKAVEPLKLNAILLQDTNLPWRSQQGQDTNTTLQLSQKSLRLVCAKYVCTTSLDHWSPKPI